ncbi:unnamed protein product [Durusdinium trenchii]|uniref:Uncharacterized protein n=1 Tax=Durusdinium trenchii TaxID=1381693 RepID=A0ABP0KIG1_9DINO
MLGYDENSKPSPSARAEQKGLAAHVLILEAYLQGVALKEKDEVVVFDVLPNRWAEFGRAIVQQKLTGSKMQNVSYLGLLKDSQQDVVPMVEEVVYNWWDQSSHAPPKRRPRDPATIPDLRVLRWENDRPKVPPGVLDKFPRGSEQYNVLSELLNELKVLWPDADDQSAVTARPQNMTSRANPSNPSARATGSPDFTNSDLLDLEREVDLVKIPSESFSEERLALCPGKSGRPSIVISKTYGVFLGNFTTEEMLVKPGELFGFNTGAFQVLIIRGALALLGSGHQETATLPWRLASDMSLVAHEKQCMPLCTFLCKMARERGLADFTVWDHEIEPKTRTVTENGAESTVTVPFRYNVRVPDSNKCNCFKPNALVNPDTEAHKPASLGAVFVGNLNHVLRQENCKHAALVWEAAPA